jgi:hypothetical protein
VNDPNERPFDPRRVSEADSKLAAAVFEQIACALAPAAMAATRREHLRRVVRSSASAGRRRLK